MNAANHWADVMRSAGGRVAPGTSISDKAKLDGPVDLAHNVTIYQHCSVGRYTYINVGSVLFANCAVGRFCSIGRGVELGLARHPMGALSTHPFVVSGDLYKGDRMYAGLRRTQQRWVFHERTEVGSDVWIGNKAMVSAGVRVGHGAVIAAGAVVVSDVAPYCIVGGVPARPLKFRFAENIIDALLDLSWWDMPLSELDNIPFFEVDKAIEELRIRKMRLGKDGIAAL